MKIEKVVEEFLKLLSQEKVEEAEELIVGEAKGREDDVASYLVAVGIGIWDEGYHSVTFYCLETAGKVAKSENLKEVIIQNLAIAHNNYGVLLQKTGKYEEAESHYKESLRINPEYADAHNNYGVLLQEMKRYEEAESHFEESLRINPEYAGAHYNYSILLQEMGKHKDAESHYKECLRINPEYTQAHNNYGVLLQEMGKYEDAEFHFEESLRINPEYTQAHYNYGIQLAEMGKHEEAESHYKESLRINPEYAQAHINYGNLLKDMGKHKDAALHYKESLRINPEDAQAHYNYGVLLQKTGKYEDAELHYKESLRINPEYADAHNNYGVLLQEMKKYEEAESHFKESLRINPEHADAHYNYGILLQDMGKHKDAELKYKESLRINPEHADAHINYGNLLQEMKRYEEAESHFKESLRINPEDAGAHINCGILLAETGKYEEAESHFKESLRINPEDADANANLGILYFTTGDLENAVQWLRKASHLLRREGKRIDSTRMNGLADWALARKFWENFSSSRKETYVNLEESRKYYLEAAAKFEDMGVPELHPFFEFISNAIFIGKDFLLSLDSENLKELQIRVTEVYKEFLPVYQDISEISFPDIDLLNAQFTCIETLTKCLNYEDIDYAPIHTAIDIFSRYHFSEPLQASTALINFIDEFEKCRKEYRALEEIPEDKQRALLRMVKPFSALDSITTRKIDQLTSEKYATPYTEGLKRLEEKIERVEKGIEKVGEGIEETRKDIRESEERMVLRIEQLFEKHHHELLERIAALNSTQVEELKNAISRIIEERIENIKDPNKKEKNRNEYNKWKKTFKAANTALQIAGSVASIYTLFAGGRPEEAVNGISTVISIALSKIERI